MAMALALWVVFSGAASVTPQANHYRVGVLLSRSTFKPALEGLREGLATQGYIEEKNITFTVEDADGDVESLDKRAATLVQAKPDVLFTITMAPTIAAKQATSTTPIVFTMVSDPVGAGVIASFATSENNLTGITSYAGPLSGKRLEILQAVAPKIKRVLVLVSPQEGVATRSFQFLAEAAPKLGIELLRRDVTSREEIVQTLKDLPRGAMDAIYFVPSELVGNHLRHLIDKAVEDKIPLTVNEQAMVEQGALMSYGANQRLLGIQAAKLVAKIFKGAKPSELPVQMPDKLPLAINLTTARAIGLDIPRHMLERTDRFVE
jgi:ABC-type uncharacterized transport system substrate-binding protein